MCVIVSQYLSSWCERQSQREQCCGPEKVTVGHSIECQRRGLQLVSLSCDLRKQRDIPCAAAFADVVTRVEMQKSCVAAIADIIAAILTCATHRGAEMQTLVFLGAPGKSTERLFMSCDAGVTFMIWLLECQLWCVLLHHVCTERKLTHLLLVSWQIEMRYIATRRHVVRTYAGTQTMDWPCHCSLDVWFGQGVRFLTGV